ncbi:carbonic anhydrase [Asanoa sp. WMMD1127]|uniref:carbonic anhydrase n=1 Tax=Asanoa sp. WMMD1127 TaxID=3016107 RepID=UPI002416326F|nr:carbonic anhydrase [Asanoa sp. WMMD1127]MDG4824222.1 carbonic anhydrase [Asanoa sp. WMMD1127]
MSESSTHAHVLSRRGVLAGMGAVGVAAGLAGVAAAPAVAAAATPTTPGAALASLLAGNARFRSGHGRHPHQTIADVHRLAAGQDPFVIVLGCADSRVSPEVLFDQGLGDIFDNRVAGNIVDPVVTGSIEYAVAEFASPLLVVLGHERCGAVAATVESLESGTTPPGSIGAIVEALRPAVEPVLHEPGDTVENAVRANVRYQVRRLVAGSAIVRDAIAARTLRVVGARYDLDTAAVSLL